MPKNGVAVHLAPTPTSASPSPQEDIRTAIGEAMVAAVVGIGGALAEFENGGLTNTTRTANGERVARLYELQQSSLDEINFPVVAREQGKVALRQFLAAGDFYSQHSTEQGDAVLDMLIGDVLAVLRKVTALEAAWANTRSFIAPPIFFPVSIPV